MNSLVIKPLDKNHLTSLLLSSQTANQDDSFVGENVSCIMTAAISRTNKGPGPSLFKQATEDKKRRKKVMTPAVNIDETDHEYIMMLAAPGFSKEALKVKIEKNILSVEASKKPDNLDYIHDCCEYDLNHWKREFLLPEDADGLMTRAKYLNGELIIRIPKGKTEDSPFVIPIYVY